MNPNFLPEQERGHGPDDLVGPPAPSAALLAQACSALWLSTLSLMAAHMRSQERAERCMLARRIGSNLQTLAQQACFDETSRARFARLGLHWHGRADREQTDPDELQAHTAFWQGLWVSDESRC